MSLLRDWVLFVEARKAILLWPLTAIILACIAIFLAGLANGQTVSPFAYRVF